ncbi:MAG: hypothetical protein KDC67_11115, partial [Ignavibacteriae bacterium]|nr:hypothetical protein [Ignavibacteriota bacterium]
VEVERVKLKRGEEYIKIIDIAKLCGVNYENIRFAIHLGILKRVDLNTSKRGTIYIEKSEAKSFNRKYVFAGALAKKYKINNTNLAEKMISQGITPVSGPNIDGGLTYLFKRSDVAKISMKQLSTLENYPTKTGRKKGDPKKIKDPLSVNLEVVKEKLKISNSKLIGLIDKGILKMQPNKVREVRITKSSFDKICKILDSQELVDLNQAIDKTKESKIAFYKRWINTGFVNLIDIDIKKFISKDDLKKIQQFKSKFVTCEEGGQITNTNRTYLPNLEKLGKIKTAKYLFNKGRPIRFYLRSEVVQIANNLHGKEK